MDETTSAIFPFSTGNTFFRKIWSKKSKVQIKQKFVTYSHFINILRLFDVLPNFFSLQAKRCAIITYQYGIYELLYELLNDIAPRILGN